MRTTPNVELIYNRRHTATTTKEAAVELRVSFHKQQKYMSTGIKLLPKHWHRGRVSGRTDAILINQTLDKLVNDVRKVIYAMMEEDDIDIFAIPGRLNQMRSGGISFLDYCEKRAEVLRFGKSADSKTRYERFMRKYREWGGIRDWADITEEKIIEFDKYLSAKGMKPYSKWNNYHRFLNSFIIDAISEGIIRRNPYHWLKIEKDKSNGGIGKHLSAEEFHRIKNIQLATESLERVRDLFVFQTYTCLSYVDFHKDYRKVVCSCR